MATTSTTLDLSTISASFTENSRNTYQLVNIYASKSFGMPDDSYNDELTISQKAMRVHQVRANNEYTSFLSSFKMIIGKKFDSIFQMCSVIKVAVDAYDVQHSLPRLEMTVEYVYTHSSGKRETGKFCVTR